MLAPLYLSLPLLGLVKAAVDQAILISLVAQAIAAPRHANMRATDASSVGNNAKVHHHAKETTADITILDTTERRPTFMPEYLQPSH